MGLFDSGYLKQLVDTLSGKRTYTIANALTGPNNSPKPSYLDVKGKERLVFRVDGTSMNGTLKMKAEGTLTGSTITDALPIYFLANGSPSQVPGSATYAATGNGTYYINLSGYDQVRVFVDELSAGSVKAYGTFEREIGVKNLSKEIVVAASLAAPNSATKPSWENVEGNAIAVLRVAGVSFAGTLVVNVEGRNGGTTAVTLSGFNLADGSIVTNIIANGTYYFLLNGFSEVRAWVNAISAGTVTAYMTFKPNRESLLITAPTQNVKLVESKTETIVYDKTSSGVSFFEPVSTGNKAFVWPHMSGGKFEQLILIENGMDQPMKNIKMTGAKTLTTKFSDYFFVVDELAAGAHMWLASDISGNLVAYVGAEGRHITAVTDLRLPWPFLRMVYDINTARTTGEVTLTSFQRY